MLAKIADECRRWTSGLPVEIALVFPIVAGAATPALAIERGGGASAGMAADRVLRVALAAGADELVVAHNHNNSSEPGPADLAVTRRLVAACAVVGLRLRAHIVVTCRGWYDCVDPVRDLHPWIDGTAA